MIKLNEVLAEAKAVALAESLRLLEIDHTDYAIKLRLTMIVKSLSKFMPTKPPPS